MPAHEEDKQSIQKKLLQELRDLQDVLNAEADDAIPVLSDVIEVSSTGDSAYAESEIDSDDATPDVELNDEDDGIPLLLLDDDVPVLDSIAADADADHSAAESAANDATAESLPPPSLKKVEKVEKVEKTTKSAPFAFVDSTADDSSNDSSIDSSSEYDSSTAESLIEEGLHEALQALTAQMDDEALRLVDQLVAEHAELIRQQLKLKLAVKNQQLRADRDGRTP